MAAIYDIAGTTNHSFTIGEDGVTTYWGKSEPLSYMGKIGDTYVQTLNEIEDEQHEGTGEFLKFGRMYVKMVVDGTEQWVIIKNHSFDTPIIVENETGEDTNNYKISLKNADNTNSSHTVDKTSTQASDYTVNHDNYGVTRYTTDDEAVASAISNYKTYTNIPSNFNKNTSTHKFEDKFISMTPEQIGKNIKVEMTRAINVEGYLKNYQTSNGRFTSTPNLVGAINELDTAIGNLPSLNTTVAQTNLVSAINDEIARAKATEGDITQLRTTNKTNLTLALNSELDDRINSDNNLQRQIDAITSKTDVVDVVQCYNKNNVTGATTDIVHYDTSTLGDDDVIKVLKDETHNNEVSYYRYNCIPESAIVHVATKAELDAYDKTHLQADDIAIVQSDSSHSNQRTYYKLSVSGSTKTWVYQGITSESWTYVGSVEAYYTKADSDARFLHISEADTNITGNKTFKSSATVKFENGSVQLGNNATATTQAASDNSTKVATTAWVNDLSNDVVHKSGSETITGTKTFTSTDGIYVKGDDDFVNVTESKANNVLRGLDSTNKLVNALYNYRSYSSTVGESSTGYWHRALSLGTADSYGDLRNMVTDNGKAKLSYTVHNAENLNVTSITNSTTSDNIATMGWVNNPSTSTNIVHRTGNESITGTKTFTSNVVIPQTPTANTHATSKKYVDDGLSVKFNTADFHIETSTANQVLYIKDDETFAWKTVRDLTELSELDDTTISSPTAGQTLIYNATSRKWVNGRQTTATISYW